MLGKKTVVFNSWSARSVEKGKKGLPTYQRSLILFSVAGVSVERKNHTNTERSTILATNTFKNSDCKPEKSDRKESIEVDRMPLTLTIISISVQTPAHWSNINKLNLNFNIY